MPRTSRSVAQRLASQRSSKKRRPSRSGTPASAPAPSAEQAPAESSNVSVDQILDEVVPSAAGARTAATSTLAPSPNRSPAAARRAGAGSGRFAAKPAVVRRRYSEYGEEYAYVWSDLRRIVVVAGVLIALLIVASFFIQ
jgi:hypothetical protein